MRAAKRRLDTTTSCKPKKDRQAAAAALYNFAVQEWSSGRLDNKGFATWAFFVTEAGAEGLEDFAVDPDTKGGNQARKVRETFGINLDDKLYTLEDVPFWDIQSNTRTLQSFSLRLPHEVLLEQYTWDPGSFCVANYDPVDWQVPSFMEHPLVVEHGICNVAAIGFYTDKVAYSKNDSFYRGSVSCIWSKRRFTSWVVQSKYLCKCGCNGMCTLQPIQVAFNKSLNALQNKLFWDCRHDNTPWQPRDACRTKRKGAMPTPWCAVIEHRADWPERVALAGLSQHSGWLPCASCESTKRTLHSKYNEETVDYSPFNPRSQETYLEDVRRHTHHVTVSTELQRVLLTIKLQFRRKYPWGRYLTTDFGSIKKGSKLCSYAGSLLSLHHLETVQLPAHLVFLEPSRASQVTSLSLLWNIPNVRPYNI